MRNRRLETVAFIATMLVVMCHADDVLPPDRASCWSSYFGTFFSAGDTPNFFCLSGYFLALKYGSASWWQVAILKRVRTLVVPYLLWGGLLFGVCLVCSLLINGLQAPILSVFHEWDGGVSRILGLRFVGGPMACGPLWYVKTILYFVVVSPPFFLIIRRRWWAVIFLVLGCLVLDYLVAGNPVAQSLFHRGFSLVGFASFLVGAAFAIHPVKVAWLKKKNHWLAICSLLAWGSFAVVTQMACGNGWVYAWIVRTLNIAVAVTALQLATIGCPLTVPGWLSGLTFFIYVTHVFFIQNVCKYVVSGGYAAVLSVALALSISTGCFCRRIVPRWFGVLTGGRG